MCKFVFGDENFLFFVDKHSLLSLIGSGSYKLIVAGMLKVNVHTVFPYAQVACTKTRNNETKRPKRNDRNDRNERNGRNETTETTETSETTETNKIISK